MSDVRFLNKCCILKGSLGPEFNPLMFEQVIFSLDLCFILGLFWRVLVGKSLIVYVLFIGEYLFFLGCFVLLVLVWDF